MDKRNWIIIVLGIMLIAAASFAFGDPSLSPGAQSIPNDFQVLLGMSGVATIIAGIIAN